jgi:hypothetical protein
VGDVGISCYALGNRRFGFLWMILILEHALCHINSRARQGSCTVCEQTSGVGEKQLNIL